MTFALFYDANETGSENKSSMPRPKTIHMQHVRLEKTRPMCAGCAGYKLEGGGTLLFACRQAVTQHSDERASFFVIRGINSGSY